MKCVKAVGVANWSVACTEKNKAWQEAGEGNGARKSEREGSSGRRAVVDCGDQETYCGVSLFVAALATPDAQCEREREEKQRIANAI